MGSPTYSATDTAGGAAPATHPHLGMTAAEIIDHARAEIAAEGGGEWDQVEYARLGDTPCTMPRIEAHIRRVPYTEVKEL